MSLSCVVCGATRASGRIFVWCDHCGANFCSRHGNKGNSCGRCGHKYLRGS
jgi:DNA-directed RNA polymerase subunit RPC12/RpoP